MEKYVFTGKIWPEALSIQSRMHGVFTHTIIPGDIEINVEIENNEVKASTTTTEAVDLIFDLRNLVFDFINHRLAMLNYATGNTLEIDISRVQNENQQLDEPILRYIPCIAERNREIDLQAWISEVDRKSSGPHGFYIHRSLNDLSSAMKYPMDTAWYCYRAIETLRIHHSQNQTPPIADRDEQWESFREVTGITEEQTRRVWDASGELRHGRTITVSDQDRQDLFNLTWDIVDAYLQAI